MSEISSEKFLLTTKKSGLVSEDDLARCLAAWADKSRGPLPSDPRKIAELLIEAELINRWQAENLLKGKYKGFRIGKYKVLGHLGKGGMSQVYLAEHSVMERLVAIKVLPSRFVENSNYLDRFKREARAVAALDHPNIVRAYDIDQDGKTHYIVMEYVEGRDLQRIISEDGTFDAVDAADYIAQAALGLQHAHEAGLVHRDVKPANCLVDNRRTLKLLDMGLAKFSEDHHPSISAIHDDSVVGTADYLAPEQARNSQNVDARADIYSLGCTLYFTLTGQPPFPDGSIAQRLLKHQNESPPSIYEKRPEIPPALVELCGRMMKKSADQRIQTAADVALELRRWLASRGKSLSATYTEAKSTAELTTGSDGSDRSWKRASRFTDSPFTDPPGVRRNDTVSSSNDDTSLRSSGSSVNDDLTLAPIEDEKKSSDSGFDSSSSVFKTTGDEPATKTRSEESSSGIFDTASEPAAATYDSGPLDALLEDPSFSSGPQLPKAQRLTTRRNRGWDGKWYLAIIVAAIVAIGLGFLLISLIF